MAWRATSSPRASDLTHASYFLRHSPFTVASVCSIHTFSSHVFSYILTLTPEQHGNELKWYKNTLSDHWLLDFLTVCCRSSLLWKSLLCVGVTQKRPCVSRTQKHRQRRWSHTADNEDFICFNNLHFFQKQLVQRLEWLWPQPWHLQVSGQLSRSTTTGVGGKLRNKLPAGTRAVFVWQLVLDHMERLFSDIERRINL